MKPAPRPAERFALPPNPPKGSQSTSDKGRGAEEEQGPTRILIVEDDFLIAMQTEIALTEAGFSVVGIATTAEEARRMRLGGCPRPVMAQRNPSMTPAMGLRP